VRLNIIFFVAGVILLLTAILFDVNYLDYNNPIPFDKCQTITLYDFKGLKRPGNTLDGSHKFAYIKTSRKINYLGDGVIRITAYFHPSRSYVFNQYTRSPDLLRHELYHFFITEYFTRLLRRDIQAYQGEITHRIIRDLDKKYILLENEMQWQYDEESYHSYVLQAQKNWETSLDNKLLSLADFSNPLLNTKK